MIFFCNIGARSVIHVQRLMFIIARLGAVHMIKDVIVIYGYMKQF